ncbi:MAG: phage head closure protein [Acutalibacter sp.]|nr:phage head closure protein [Acutalibacter sp.]
MFWRHMATLIQVEKTVDKDGYKSQQEAKREVFVNKKSATRSEFYQAKQAGDKIVLVLEVHGVDYQDETIIEFEGKRYEVVRAYTKNGEIFELNCKEAPKPNGKAVESGEGETV